MRFLKPLALAVALGSATLAPAALAQPSGSTVMVINYDRLIAETDAGRSMNTQLQTLQTTMQGELRPEGQSIETEETAIRTAIGSRAPEAVRSDAALQRRIEALTRRVEAYRTRGATVSRDFEYTRQMAINAFNEQITPIVRELMESRGVAVTLDSTAANLVLPSADATADVVSRVNQRIRTFTVTRRTAPAPQQQSGQSGSGNQGSGNRRN